MEDFRLTQTGEEVQALLDTVENPATTEEIEEYFSDN